MQAAQRPSMSGSKYRILEHWGQEAWSLTGILKVRSIKIIAASEYLRVLYLQPVPPLADSLVSLTWFQNVVIYCH